MSQHVSHRASDEIAQLNTKVAALEAELAAARKTLDDTLRALETTRKRGVEAEAKLAAAREALGILRYCPSMKCKHCIKLIGKALTHGQPAASAPEEKP